MYHTLELTHWTVHVRQCLRGSVPFTIYEVIRLHALARTIARGAQIFMSLHLPGVRLAQSLWLEGQQVIQAMSSAYRRRQLSAKRNSLFC